MPASSGERDSQDGEPDEFLPFLIGNEGALQKVQDTTGGGKCRGGGEFKKVKRNFKSGRIAMSISLRAASEKRRRSKEKA